MHLDTDNQPIPLSGELPTLTVVPALYRTRDDQVSDADPLQWPALGTLGERSKYGAPFLLPSRKTR